MEEPRSEGIFKVNLPTPKPIPPKVIKKVEDAIYHLFKLKKLDDIYSGSCGAGDLPCFLKKTLECIGVTTSLKADGLEQIPQKGPVIVVANHPFGGLEGLILGYHLLQVRPDVKIMANYMLSRIPELRELFLFVDPFDNSRNIGGNIRPLRESITWVKDGGLLGIFPAGEVAHMKLKNMRINEPAWNEVVARIAQRTKATVVPVFFKGRNSLFFQVAGIIHPRLRTAMLPRELANKSGKDIRLVVGGPIIHKRYSQLEDTQAVTDYFRWRTFLLKRSAAVKKRTKIPPKKLLSRGPRQEAIAEPVARELVLHDVYSLPKEQWLVSSGEYSVFYARKSQIPNLIQEIGRMREISFRQVGEGTGMEIDLDRYDESYFHMVLWNTKENELVGGYRMGPTDEILAAKGRKGLYTSSLFKVKREFFRNITGLEMGRSYIVDKYQRAYSALLLLWRGIGQLVLRFPQYRYLFGPVSVSNQYRPLTRRLIVRYMENNHPSSMAHLVRPRRPALFLTRNSRLINRVLERVHSFEEMSDIVMDIEGGEMGAPILLKQYIKLGCKSCGWNLDPDFGKTLDCFILTDLVKADSKTMKFYMGKDGYEEFLAYHSQ